MIKTDEKKDLSFIFTIPHRKQYLCHILPAAGIDSAWKAACPQRGQWGVSSLLNGIVISHNRIVP